MFLQSWKPQRWNQQWQKQILHHHHRQQNNDNKCLFDHLGSLWQCSHWPAPSHFTTFPISICSDQQHSGLPDLQETGALYQEMATIAIINWRGPTAQWKRQPFLQDATLHTNPPLSYASLDLMLISNPRWNYFKQKSNSFFRQSDADRLTFNCLQAEHTAENLFVLSRNT